MADFWNNNDPILVDFSSVENSVDENITVDNENTMEVSRSLLGDQKKDGNTTADKIRYK